MEKAVRTKTLVQCAGNILRLGGGSGGHTAIPVAGDESSDQKKFYYTDNEGQIFYLQCGFEDKRYKGQEEGLFGFVATTFPTEQQDKWDEILAERCYTVQRVIEQNYTFQGDEDKKKLPLAIAIMQLGTAGEDKNKWAVEYLKKIMTSGSNTPNKRIMDLVEEKMNGHIFSVPGHEENLAIQMLYAPQYNGRGGRPTLDIMYRGNEIINSEVFANSNVIPNLNIVKERFTQAQEKIESFDEVISHIVVTQIGNEIYAPQNPVVRDKYTEKLTKGFNEYKESLKGKKYEVETAKDIAAKIDKILKDAKDLTKISQGTEPQPTTKTSQGTGLPPTTEISQEPLTQEVSQEPQPQPPLTPEILQGTEPQRLPTTLKTDMLKEDKENHDSLKQGYGKNNKYDSGDLQKYLKPESYIGWGFEVEKGGEGGQYIVTKVTAGGLADAIGLNRGDIIKVNTDNITDNVDLAHQFRSGSLVGVEQIGGYRGSDIEKLRTLYGNHEIKKPFCHQVGAPYQLNDKKTIFEEEKLYQDPFYLKRYTMNENFNKIKNPPADQALSGDIIDNDGRGLRCAYYAIAAAILNLEPEAREGIIGNIQNISKNTTLPQFSRERYIFKNDDQYILGDIICANYIDKVNEKIQKNMQTILKGVTDVKDRDSLNILIKNNIGDKNLFAEQLQLLCSELGLNVKINDHDYGLQPKKVGPNINIINSNSHYQALIPKNQQTPPNSSLRPVGTAGASQEQLPGQNR